MPKPLCGGKLIASSTARPVMRSRLWRTARPTCSIRRCLKRVIDRALEKDRAKATAEYLAEFRTDLQGFVTLRARVRRGGRSLSGREELQRFNLLQGTTQRDHVTQPRAAAVSSSVSWPLPARAAAGEGRAHEGPGRGCGHHYRRPSLGGGRCGE